MTGPEKQLITKIRAEFRDVMNLVDIDKDFESAEEYADELIKRLIAFNALLNSLDETVEYDNVLKASVNETQNVVDKFM